MANGRNGTLYTGVTSDLIKRVHERRTDALDGFTRHYCVHHLVWYEQHGDMHTAIAPGKSDQGMETDVKLRLIEGMNPHWRDLYPDIVDGWSRWIPACAGMTAWRAG